ncbi:MAG: hypothetical protein U5N85_10495 [Arcicella sp.]|nr:hypothetical protein [Arcicella sp.]
MTQTEIKDNNPDNFKKWVKISMVVIGISFFLYLFYQQWYEGLNPRLFDKIVEHYAVFLTVPCAGFAALILVVCLDQAYGAVNFSIFQLKFEGASGQIILWILVYLSIILSIKLLW